MEHGLEIGEVQGDVRVKRWGVFLYLDMYGL